MSTSSPIAVISPHIWRTANSLEMVGRIGIEPMTNGLKVGSPPPQPAILRESTRF